MIGAKRVQIKDVRTRRGKREEERKKISGVDEKERESRTRDGERERAGRFDTFLCCATPA